MPLVLSVAAAAATVFVIRFVRALVRISANEVSCRMYAWATQAIALVVIADIGLFLLFEELSLQRALLLGIFVGATGDHALDLLLSKAATLFKATAPAPRGPSPLLFLEGMTSEHVDRLEEESIASIHDLAFVPTARLFFGTAYSLQQICDWQDRALLHVYVGSDGVKGLAVRMKIVGAIDLMFCCRTILHERSTAVAKPEHPREEQLMSALGLERDGLTQLLDSFEHDEMIMRLRVYWQSSVRDHDPQEELASASQPLAGGVQATPALS